LRRIVAEIACGFAVRICPAKPRVRAKGSPRGVLDPFLQRQSSKRSAARKTPLANFDFHLIFCTPLRYPCRGSIARRNFSLIRLVFPDYLVHRPLKLEGRLIALMRHGSRPAETIPNKIEVCDERLSCCPPRVQQMHSACKSNASRNSAQ
jgi:hypothetical protein